MNHFATIALLMSLYYFDAGSSANNHFVHGSKHSYNHHDSSNSIENREKHVIHLHPHNMGKLLLPNHLIDRFEYDLEFKDDVVMIQLDHHEFIENIDYIQCLDPAISEIDICFKDDHNLSEFVDELKFEIDAIHGDDYNGSFIIISSDESQWINCHENMNEISLVRMFDLEHCSLNHDNYCLQCNEIKNINHQDIIKNGQITFHTVDTTNKGSKTNKQPQAMNNNMKYKNQRNLLTTSGNTTYTLGLRTCSWINGGGSDDQIAIIVEGDSGSQTSPIYGYFTSSGNDYTVSFTAEDVGEVQKVYFVNYGKDDLKIKEISLNGKTAGYDWSSCAVSTFEPSSDSTGCGVLEIDLVNDIFNEYEQLGPCTIIEGYTKEVNKTYNIVIDVTNDSEDEIYILIQGLDGNITNPHSLGTITQTGTYSYHLSDIDVGIISHVHLVNFGEDKFCIDEVTVDGNLHWDASWLSSECAQYKSSYPGGCGLATIDFVNDDNDDLEQIPCEIMEPAQWISNPSGRRYTLKIETTFRFGAGGSDDYIEIIIVGNLNKTSAHSINMADASEEYVFYINDDIDVGYIESIYLVSFGSDDVCFDYLSIDDTYIYDKTCLFCGSSCVGYNSWQESGCNTVKIDFFDCNLKV